MKSPLDILADIQVKRTNLVIAVGILLTVVLSLGVPKIYLETDFQESLPDDLPPIKTQEEINNKFSQTDSIIILFQLTDDPIEEKYVNDVREPRFIESLSFLQEELQREPLVDSAFSLASPFPRVPGSKREVKEMLKEVNRPGLTNRDYTATTMFVKLSEESTEENVREATQIIKQNVEETPLYPGVDTVVTGLPVTRTDLSDVLVSDSKFTITVASVLILILLVVVRGLQQGFITFVPLVFGLTWTIGAMGFLGIPLTIATIALGAMILGLGVEYGSFITERIVEEAKEMDIEKAVKTSVPNTGKAITGSSMTTIVGFAALIVASLSFIRDLGKTLALGIFLTQSAAVCLTPALILKYRRWKG